jgi:D-alanyl-lipoteichoic acid acyltransferase DltB (MBOAT superfamily)
LLQGPIERAGDLIPQLQKKYEFNYDNMRFGMLLFTWGLFKKVVIADRLGLYVDAVYKDVHAFTGLSLLLATYAYAFQIYLDFSGYTDMALGSARLFNINLTQNFNSPYLATSVADFWRRWHISFSRWILDYIFKPLQMQWRNWKTWGTATALVVAFLVSGIWHGASWGFVIWGGLHGLYLACSVFYKPYQKKLHKAIGLEKTRLLKIWRIFVTFNLVSFTWVFFRAGSLKDAFYVIANMLNGVKGVRSGFLLSQGIQELALTSVAILLFVCFALNIFKQNVINGFNRKSALYRYVTYSTTILMIFFLAKYSSPKTFIYFQF